MGSNTRLYCRHRIDTFPVTAMHAEPLLRSRACTTPLSAPTVQVEWDHTLRRLRALCTMQYATERVDQHRYPTVNLRHTPDLEVVALERVLFENLLLAPLHRLEYGRTIVFRCEWLWQWRQAVPWRLDGADRTLGMSPDDPKNMYTYRYQLLFAEGSA